MKKQIRLVALLCVAILVFGLAGCGSANRDPAADGTDLGGRNFKILINSWSAPDLTDEKNSFAQTAKKYNCTFTFEEFSDEIGTYNELVLSYLSGKASCDALVMRGYNVCPTYSASGVILNMSEYHDFAQDATWQNDLVKDMGVWRGNRYGLPVTPKQTGYGIWYNRKLLADANIPDLWDYVDKGEWTFQTFRDVLKKLTVQTGANKRYGFYSEDMISNFILANGGTFIDDSGDAAKLMIDDPKAITAMEYLVELTNTDKTVPTETTVEELGSPFVLDMMADGQVAMTAYDAWGGPYLQNKGIDPENLGWVYWPQGPDATENIVPGATPSRMMVIPAKAEKPGEIVEVLADALGFWGEGKAYPRAIESAYDAVLEDDQMLDIMVGNNKKCYLEGAARTRYSNLCNYEGINSVYSEMKEKIAKNELSPKAAVDAYFAKIQSKMEIIENGINLEDYQ